MSDTTLLALFEDIDPAADAVEKLHEMGLQMTISMSSLVCRLSHINAGRPHPLTNVSRLALGGAVAGFCSACF